MPRRSPHPIRPLAWGLCASLLATAGSPAPQDRAPQDRATPEQIASYFVICDRDGNGWISYREARESVQLDRDGYLRFDTDGDGRVTLEEFRAGYERIADRVGYLPRPRTARADIVDLPRRPEQILTAYDLSGDASLDLDELETLLFDYGRTEIPVELAFGKLDEDADGGLRDGELELLSRLLATLHAAGPADEESGSEPPPASLEELFAKAVPRPGELDRAPQPPLIVGPASIFRRLDLDDDGGVEVDDLRGLLSPLQITPRLTAIHATIDLDEDGRIDPDELALALGAR